MKTKRIIVFILIATFLVPMTQAYATPVKVDPYTIKAQFVQELLDINEDELANLSIAEASKLFEKAFSARATDYTEDQIRLALDSLSFYFKFSDITNTIRETEEHMPINPLSRSSLQGIDYQGSIGVAWIRDTRSGYSPLTLAEALSSYTLEVDFLRYETVAVILAASANYNVFSDLDEQVALGASSTVLTAIVCSTLGITGMPATITSVIVGSVVGLTWNYLAKIDRSRMYNAFTNMNKNQYMKVEFVWANGTVNKIFTLMNYYPNASLLPPFSGLWGDWYPNRFGILHNY